jgi:hypothetical protein
VLHEDHLARYRVRAATGAPRFVRARGLALENQVGTLLVDAVARDSLLVPAAMSLGAPPGDPVPPNPDGFVCYKARASAGRAGFVPVEDVAIADRFGTARVHLTKLTRVCAPASLAGEDPTAPTYSTWLLCYKTSPAGDRTFLPRVVSTDDRFPPQTLYLTKREEVCLPSLRLAAP